MKNMTTLSKVFNKVDDLSRNCTDRSVKVSDLSFENLDRVSISGESHQMRPIAQGSVAYRLGIPFQYLKRCPPNLQETQMNYWIKYEKNEELFFRFDGEEVRAVFTPRYIPVDNFEVLEKLDSLGYGSETPVQCHLDAEFMLLNIPDGEKAFSINGDRMTPGISISNSEVGSASLSITAFVLRLVCTNGLISKTQVGASYRHVSRKILEEFPAILSNVSHELGKQTHRIRLSTESQVDDPESTLESFSRQFQLNEDEREAVKWAWPMEAGQTMFHVVNAYTRAAQMESLPAGSAYRLQRTAGNILEMLN
jgi:hypothetical protein